MRIASVNGAGGMTLHLQPCKFVAGRLQQSCKCSARSCTAMQTTSITRAIDLFLDAVRGEHTGPSAWAEHAPHVLELGAEDQIARASTWCGGRWPVTLLAELEAARDAS